MKFIGSAAVAVIVLWSVDERLNDARLTHMAVVGLREVSRACLPGSLTSIHAAARRSCANRDGEGKAIR